MRRLVMNAGVLAFGTFVSQVLGAIGFWVCARSLGPGSFGLLLAVVSVGLLAIAVSDFGVNAWSVRDLAARPDAAVRFRQTFNAKLWMAAGLSSAFLLGAVACSLSVGTSWNYVVLSPWLGLAIVGGTLLAPLRAGEKMASVAVALVLEKAITLLVVVVVTLSGAKEGALPWGLVAGSFAAAVYCAQRVDRSLLTLQRVKMRDVRVLWKQTAGFGASTLCIQAQRLDVSIVGMVAGASAAGIFGAPARVTGLLGILPTALSGAAFPAASKRLERRAALGAMSLMMVAMLALLSATFIFAQPLVDTVLGTSYAGSADVLRIFTVGLVFASINQPLATVLQAQRQEHRVARSTASATFLGLAAVAGGGAVGGADGAALGFVVQQVLLLIGLSRLADRKMFSHDHSLELASANS